MCDMMYHQALAASQLTTLQGYTPDQLEKITATGATKRKMPPTKSEAAAAVQSSAPPQPQLPDAKKVKPDHPSQQPPQPQPQPPKPQPILICSDDEGDLGDSDEEDATEREELRKRRAADERFVSLVEGYIDKAKARELQTLIDDLECHEHDWSVLMEQHGRWCRKVATVVRSGNTDLLLALYAILAETDEARNTVIADQQKTLGLLQMTMDADHLEMFRLLYEGDDGCGLEDLVDHDALREMLETRAHGCPRIYNYLRRNAQVDLPPWYEVEPPTTPLTDAQKALVDTVEDIIDRGDAEALEKLIMSDPPDDQMEALWSQAKLWRSKVRTIVGEGNVDLLHELRTLLGRDESEREATMAELEREHGLLEVALRDDNIDMFRELYQSEDGCGLEKTRDASELSEMLRRHPETEDVRAYLTEFLDIDTDDESDEEEDEADDSMTAKLKKMTPYQLIKHVESLLDLGDAAALETLLDEIDTSGREWKTLMTMANKWQARVLPLVRAGNVELLHQLLKVLEGDDVHVVRNLQRSKGLLQAALARDDLAMFKYLYEADEGCNLEAWVEPEDIARMVREQEKQEPSSCPEIRDYLADCIDDLEEAQAQEDDEDEEEEEEESDDDDGRKNYDEDDGNEESDDDDEETIAVGTCRPDVAAAADATTTREKPKEGK